MTTAAGKGRRDSRRVCVASIVFVLTLACAGLAAGAASADTTGIVLTLPAGPVQPGDQVTLTAVVSGTSSAPTGTVAFWEGSDQLGTATLVPGAGTDSTATFTIPFSAGPHVLTATYRDPTFTIFTSPQVTLQVGPGIIVSRTTLTLSVSPTPIVQGAQETLTAVVARVGGGGPPTGIVQFLDNGVAMSPGGSEAPLVSGTATFVATGFTAGSHTISANYLGDALDNPSSNAISSNVQPPAAAVQTTTTVTVSPTRIVAGALVTLSAHVVQTNGSLAPPQGEIVTFTVGATWVADAPLDAHGNAVAANVAGWINGTYDIKASYVGDQNFLTSAGHVPLPVLASAIPLTVTAPSAAITYGGTLPALTTPAYAGFTNGDTAASLDARATCSTTAAAGSTVGTYPVTCSGAASSVYSFTYVDGSVSIAPATLRVTAANATMVTGQPLPALTATISGFVNGETLATSGVSGAPTCTTTATTASPAGTYPITCTLGTLAATNYVFSFAAGTLTVTSPTPTVTCTGDRHSGDDRGWDWWHDRKHNSHCESLLADPSPDSGSTVSAGQTLTIVYTDENPIGTGAQAPSAVLSTGEVLPIAVTPTAHQPLRYVDDNGGSPSNRYQSLLTFRLPANLAPGTYSILVSAYDSTGNLDQWVWQIRVGKPSGHDGHGDDHADWRSFFERLLTQLRAGR